MKPITLNILILAILSGLFSPIILAQDTHYWSHQFGTRTALLSGAVLGGTTDNTMVYYNPGGLGFLDDSFLSVNANAYRIENIKIFNALGNQADFKSSNLGSIPLLAGGMVRFKDSKWKFGYGFMAPVDFNFKGIARVDGNYNIIDEAESVGAEELVGESSVATKLNEVLVAFGLGRKISEHFSVGFTNLITVRSQTYNRGYSAYVFLNDTDETFVGGNVTQNAQYYNIRYALKLGMIYKIDKWSAGLTITTPSLNIGGQGTVAANIAARNVMFNDDGERLSGVATDRQGELKTTFKSPFSISTGINYDYGKSFFGVAAQYYSNIDPYDIVDVDSRTFVRPAELAPELSSDLFLSMKSAATSVLNVSIGYEYKLKESLSLLFSARSDMSYFDSSLNKSPGIKSTISSWDLYHFTAGATFNRENSSLSLGLLFSTGTTGNYEQVGSLDEPSESNLLEGATNITKASYSSIGLLLGYTFYFKKF